MHLKLSLLRAVTHVAGKRQAANEFDEVPETIDLVEEESLIVCRLRVPSPKVYLGVWLPLIQTE